MSGRKVRHTPLSEIPLKRKKWLWTNRYKLSSLGLLAGWEGQGKSLITCWIAAQITLGKLPGELWGSPGGVLVVASEDDFSDTIAPRMKAAGADLTRVYRVDIEVGEISGIPVSLPADVPSMEQLIDDLEIKLVILDPLISRLDPGLNTHKDSDVRQALEPIVSLCHKTGCSIIGIIHLNKAMTNNPLDAIMGSKAFTAVARTVGLVCLQEDGTKLLTFPKNNNAEEQMSITYSISSISVGRDSEDNSEIDAPYVLWGAETEITARDIFQDRIDAGDKSKSSMRTRAEALIKRLLLSGEKPQKTVEDEAAKAGISKVTLDKAKRRLGVTSHKGGWDGGWMWTLTPEGGQNPYAPISSPSCPSSSLSPMESILDTGLSTKVDKVDKVDSKKGQTPSVHLPRKVFNPFEPSNFHAPTEEEVRMLEYEESIFVEDVEDDGWVSGDALR